MPIYLFILQREKRDGTDDALREPSAVIAWIRDAMTNDGIESLFLVDDDFFRSPRWEDILNGLVELKKEFPKFSFMMQVDVDASCYADIAEGESETAKHRRTSAS